MPVEVKSICESPENILSLVEKHIFQTDISELEYLFLFGFKLNGGLLC